MGFTFHFERIASSELASVCRLYMMQPNGKRMFITQGWVDFPTCVEAFREFKNALYALTPLCGYATLSPSEDEWERFNAAPQVNR